MIKNLKALLFGVILALLLCELVLRIYNPLRNFSRHGDLLLPASQQTVFVNKWLPQLDKQIRYSRNELGFRGKMPTDSIHKLNSIICIGGSTTECRFLSDDQTWPHLLQQQLQTTVPGLWINNAGIDGHSTFGHQLLLKEYIAPLKPRYVLLLTGINDVETGQPQLYDEMNRNAIQFHSVKGFIKSLFNKTETGATLFQLYAMKLAYKKGLVHKDVQFAALPDTLLQPSYMQAQQLLQQPYLSSYRNRLQQIITLCKTHHITPVLLTQPSLFGAYKDASLNLLMDFKYLPGEQPVRNNLLKGQILESYNEVVRSFAGQTPVIDLAKLMPKQTNLYYDFIHFNKSGAAQVAVVIARELQPLLLQQ